MPSTAEQIKAARERLMNEGPVAEARRLIVDVERVRDVELGRLAREMVQGETPEAGRIVEACGGADGLARLGREVGRELVRRAIERAEEDAREADSEAAAAREELRAHDEVESTRQGSRDVLVARMRKATERQEAAETRRAEARASWAAIGS